jgi:hypothetical protein
MRPGPRCRLRWWTWTHDPPAAPRQTRISLQSKGDEAHTRVSSSVHYTPLLQASPGGTRVGNYHGRLSECQRLRVDASAEGVRDVVGACGVCVLVIRRLWMDRVEVSLHTATTITPSYETSTHGRLRAKQQQLCVELRGTS